MRPLTDSEKIELIRRVNVDAGKCRTRRLAA